MEKPGGSSMIIEVRMPPRFGVWPSTGSSAAAMPPIAMARPSKRGSIRRPLIRDSPRSARSFRFGGRRGLAGQGVAVRRRGPVAAPPPECPSRLLDQAVEPTRVLAGDLAGHLGGQVPELFLDVLRRLRPDAVAVRVVGAPHERRDAHVVDQLGADAVELEGAFALPAPVVARLHLEAQVAE